jgi:Xaa-Pro aminopeptidase
MPRNEGLTTFPKQKLAKIPKLLDAENCAAWILITREHSEDRLCDDYGAGSVVGKAGIVFDRDGGRKAIAWRYDRTGLESTGFYDEVKNYGGENFFQELQKWVTKYDGKRIAVNTSQDFPWAGGLAAPMFSELKKILPNSDFVSSENVVIGLRGILEPYEVEKVRKAANHTEEIIKEVEPLLQVGTAPKQVFQEVRRKTAERGLGLAWWESMCPSVSAGDGEGGHYAYSEAPIKAGDLVRFDFGVKYEGYCSDIQKDYVVSGGKGVDQEKEKAFEVARRANDAAKAGLVEGKSGVEVDKPCRDIVLAGGYPEFWHGTGHPVGRHAHEVGPILGPKWPEAGNEVLMPIKNGMIFTIEPSIYKKGVGFINLEEDVLVTERGPEDISTPQRELMVL